MISAAVDMTGYNRVLAELSDALMGSSHDKDRADAQTILRDEAAALAVHVMHTAPPSQTPKSRSSKSDQIKGQQSIAIDLARLVGTAQPDTLLRFTREHGRRSVDGWLARKDGSSIRVRWDYVTSSTTDIKIVHRKSLGKKRRGRLKSYRRSGAGEWGKTVMTSPQIMARYVKMAQKLVGRLKSSYAHAAMRIKGGPVRGIPAWVKKHTSDSHTLTQLQQMNHRTRPSIAFGSNAGGNSRIETSLITSAVRARMHAMEKRTQLVISGYARDVRAGMKPKRRAKQHASA